MKIFDLHADLACAIEPHYKQGEHAVLRNYWGSAFEHRDIGVTSAASFFAGSQSWEEMQETVLMVKRDLEESGYKIIQNKQEIPAHPQEVQFLMTIEGMCGIDKDEEERVTWLYEQGNRIGSLAWNDENALATGNSGDPARGLTDRGRRVVKKMNELHMIVDVSHANEHTFWDILDCSELPVIATHSNAKGCCFVERNLTDQQIRALAGKDGLIGMNACRHFIDMEEEKQDALHLAKHARYIADLVGHEHIACGFDFTDYYDKENHDLSSPAKAQNFIEALTTVGFNEEQIKDIAYRNVHRFLNKCM